MKLLKFIFCCLSLNVSIAQKAVEIQEPLIENNQRLVELKSLIQSKTLLLEKLGVKEIPAIPNPYDEYFLKNHLNKLIQIEQKYTPSQNEKMN